MVNLKEIIAPHFWNTFNSKKMHQIDKGGRGSTKTSKNAIKIALHCLEEKDCCAVIIRRYQKSLRNSVYKEIKRGLRRLGCEETLDYVAYKSPLEINLLNDNRNNIYFAGGDDYEKLKGMIDESKTIKIVWFEEITEFENPDEIDQIIATFSRGNDDWFIVLYSYNPPKNKYHWVNQWAEKMALKKSCQITQSDYTTVPKEWLGRMFLEEAQEMLENDEKRYRWIYLGEVIGLEGLIYNPDLIEYVSEDYIEENKIQLLYIDIAIDSGHQTSATAVGGFGFGSDGYWYLLDTYYYSPNEKTDKKAPSDLTKDIFTFECGLIKKYKMTIDKETIDSAEGALRNQFFKDYGRRLHPVDKGKDKETLIEYSQDFLSKKKFRVLNNSNNQIFRIENEHYMWKDESVERGKPVPDKAEKEFIGMKRYFNTHTNDSAYTYADHTQDMFQYWIKDNLQKLGLKE